ncbi:hypothetical protein D3C73_1549310 [compost metagenome]
MLIQYWHKHLFQIIFDNEQRPDQRYVYQIVHYLQYEYQAEYLAYLSYTDAEHNNL